MFKEQYIKDNQMITPNPELLDKISAQMAEQVRKNEAGNHIPFGNISKIAVCAACACFIIGAAVVLPKLFSDDIPTAEAMLSAAGDCAIETKAVVTTTSPAALTTAVSDTEDGGSTELTSGTNEIEGFFIAAPENAETSENNKYGVYDDENDYYDIEENADDACIESSLAGAALPDDISGELTDAPESDDVDEDISVDIDNDDDLMNPSCGSPTDSSDTDDVVAVEEDASYDDDAAVDDDECYDDIAVSDDDDCDVSVAAEPSDQYLIENAPALNRLFKLFGEFKLSDISESGKICKLYHFDTDKFTALIGECAKAPIIEAYEFGDSKQRYFSVSSTTDKDSISFWVMDDAIMVHYYDYTSSENDLCSTYTGFYRIDAAMAQKFYDYYDAGMYDEINLTDADSVSDALAVILRHLSNSYTIQIIADLTFADGTVRQEKLHLSADSSVTLLKSLSKYKEKVHNRGGIVYSGISSITIAVTDKETNFSLTILLSDSPNPVYTICLYMGELMVAQDGDNIVSDDYLYIFTRKYTLEPDEFDKLYKLIMGDNAPSGRFVYTPDSADYSYDEEEVEDDSVEDDHSRNPKI